MSNKRADEDVTVPSHEEIAAMKSLERVQIRRELDAGETPAVVARRHQPWAQLAGEIRLDLADRLV